MKNVIFFSILFFAFANGLGAQTSTGGGFEFTQSAAYNAMDGATDTGETVTAYGQTFKIYETPKGKRFAQIRAKYLVWSSFKVVDTLPNGEPIYLSPSGTPFKFSQGKNGVWAQYGKAK
jgi:hypothetical protein